MKYSQDVLTSLKAAKGLQSDYKAAQLLGLSKQAISQIKNGHHHFSDETLIKIASILKKDPVLMVASKYAESESLILRQFWAETLDRSNTAKSLEFSGLASNRVA